MLDAFLAVLKGLPYSLLLTASAFVIGAIVAVPLALGLRSGIGPVRWLLRLIVDLVRGIPIIVWLFILKFGIQFGHWHFTALNAAIVGLSLVSAAYLAEIFRGGILAVPAGQVEAAHALGIKRAPAFARIIAPQAFRISLPSIATYLIGLFKDTSIASTIIVAEMVFQAQSFARQNPSLVGIWPYIWAGAIYIVVSIPVAMWSRRVDARLQEAK